MEKNEFNIRVLSEFLKRYGLSIVSYDLERDDDRDYTGRINVGIEAAPVNDEGKK